MDEIINQQTDTIQSPPIQQERPIKNKPSIWILFTIIFFITTLILSYLLLNQKQEIDTKETIEEKTEEIKTGIIENKDVVSSEKTIDKIPQYPSFYDEIEENIKNLCPDLLVSSATLSLNNNKGPFWWDESSQKLGSLSGYNLEARAIREDVGITEECFNNIDNYLSKNMKESTSNSPKFTNFGKEFYRHKGYEKENIKCYLTDWEPYLICGQFTETLLLIQKIYMAGVKDLYISVGRIEGKHILISSHNFGPGGGQTILEKNNDDSYSILGGSQDSWSCDMVFNHNVSPILVDNFCMTKDMDISFQKNPSTSEYTSIGYRYSVENNKWEKVRLKRENGEYEKYEE